MISSFSTIMLSSVYIFLILQDSKTIEINVGKINGAMAIV